MQRTLRNPLWAAMLLALGMLLPASAQTPVQYGLVVNGKLVERKVAYVSLTTRTIGETSAPALAVTYAPDADGKSAVEYFHPAVSKVLFGDELTGIGTPTVREIESTEDGELRFAGLQPGEQVTVYSVGGRRCLLATAAEGGVLVEMKNLPKGVYVIQAGKTSFKYMNR